VAGQWRVEVDLDRCAGSGTCWAVAPARFERGPDGQGRFRTGPATMDDVVHEAAELCPTGAIVVSDASSGP
jgi:ferredoxin